MAINKKNQKTQKNQGFTLIEVLIVVFILGVLSGIVMLSLGGAIASGTKKACEADLASVQTAITGYATDNPNIALSNFDLYFAVGANPTTGSLADLKYISPLRLPAKPKYRIAISASLTSTQLTPKVEVFGADNVTVTQTLDACPDF